MGTLFCQWHPWQDTVLMLQHPLYGVNISGRTGKSCMRHDGCVWSYTKCPRQTALGNLSRGHARSTKGTEEMLDWPHIKTIVCAERKQSVLAYVHEQRWDFGALCPAGKNMTVPRPQFRGYGISRGTASNGCKVETSCLFFQTDLRIKWGLE